jgi:hypothetical protein
MELKHVVVTSVDRDDLPDKGAGHVAATIRAEGEAARGLGRGADRRLPRLRGGRRCRSCSPSGRRCSTTTSRRCGACTGACAGRRPPRTRRSGSCIGRRSSPATRADEVGDHRRARRDERRGRRDDARPARAASMSSRSASTSSPPRGTRRSTAGCTRTSSAGSASRGDAMGFGSVFRRAARPLVLPRRRAEARRRRAGPELGVPKRGRPPRGRPP